MKKFLAFLMTVCILASVASLAVSAETMTTLSAAAGATAPDWIITEIAPDSMGAGEVAGYSDNKDPFEFFELYNNSGTTLNLYDYCVTYCGDTRSNARFENAIVEITPFKPGDYFDGITLPWSGQASECGDLSNKPVNPDTMMVAPGEIVVVWSMYYEAYLAMFNEGKGVSIDDFRAFWEIPDDVKVVAWDGNSSTKYGGNDKNFNLKNSGTGTYGIARYSEELNNLANVPDSTYPIAYTECSDLITWASLDFDNQVMGSSIGNLTYNYVWDFNGAAAEEFGYVYDARRESFVQAYSDPTPGALTPLQKAVLGVPLAAGDQIIVEELYAPYCDDTWGKFAGIVVNGTLYGLKDTFTAAADGVVTLEYKFGTVETTEPTPADTTTAKPDDTTTAPKDETTSAAPADTTVAPSGETTKAPDVTTKAPEPAKKSGCGGAVGLGIIACLIPAALVVCRKKEN